ncbi:hypothetical protein M0804_013430 [Polistes exclamans]|nr:hypothetical protein M0804_013430 [Polistes exclamans]
MMMMMMMIRIDDVDGYVETEREHCIIDRNGSIKKSDDFTLKVNFCQIEKHNREERIYSAISQQSDLFRSDSFERSHPH